MLNLDLLPSWLVLAFVLPAILLLHRYVFGKKRLPLPPGPTGWPILGKTFEAMDMSVKPWHRVQQWKRESNSTGIMASSSRRMYSR